MEKSWISKKRLEREKMRDSVVFYRSFYEAIQNLPEPEQVKAYTAIMEYALNGVQPEIDGVAAAIFLLVKPQIDANNKRYENGKRPKAKREENKPEANQKQNQSEKEAKEKQNESKPEAKPKQEETESEANENVNVKENVNVNANVLNTSVASDPGDSSPQEKNGLKMLLKGGEEYLIDSGQIEIYKELFPEIDVEQQLRFMCSWCLQNPAKRKTSRGVGRFINGWLTKEAQEAAERNKPKGKNLNNFERRRYDMDDLEARLLNV